MASRSSGASARFTTRCAGGFSSRLGFLDPRLLASRLLASRLLGCPLRLLRRGLLRGYFLRGRFPGGGLPGRLRRRQFGRRHELVDEVLLPYAVAHLHADFLARACGRDRRVFDLQRVHGLLDVRRRTLDLDRVADRERAVREPDRRDPDVAEEVEDLADLLPFHRRRMGCTAINTFAAPGAAVRISDGRTKSLKCKQELWRPRKGGMSFSW